jgi:sugar phosphate isomerase/epimerase
VKRPFRIGTTSFIHPAGWLENARRLAGRVEDVELLLFEPPDDSRGPSREEIAALASLGRDASLTFSVHAPLGIALASEDITRRRAAVAAVKGAIRVTAPLAPHSIIVHLAPGEREGGPLPADLCAFRQRAAESLREVIAEGPLPGVICLETLEYDFRIAEPIADELGLSVALDVGHLARDGAPFDDVLARNRHRTRVVHWHGTDAEGRDHRSLRHYPSGEGRRLLRALREAAFSGVLTLEVFGEADLEESLAVLAELGREAAA